MLTVIKFIVSVLTAVIGVYIFVKPDAYARLAEFSANKGRGKTEIRTIMGGTFVGLGIAPFILINSPFALTFLGIVYMFIALSRLISIFLDKSFGLTNIMILLVEVAFGLIMIIPS